MIGEHYSIWSSSHCLIYNCFIFHCSPHAYQRIKDDKFCTNLNNFVDTSVVQLKHSHIFFMFLILWWQIAQVMSGLVVILCGTDLWIVKNIKNQNFLQYAISSTTFITIWRSGTFAWCEKGNSLNESTIFLCQTSQ